MIKEVVDCKIGVIALTDHAPVLLSLVMKLSGTLRSPSGGIHGKKLKLHTYKIITGGKDIINSWPLNTNAWQQDH